MYNTQSSLSDHSSIHSVSKVSVDSLLISQQILLDSNYPYSFNVLFLECRAVRHQVTVHVSSHGSVTVQDKASVFHASWAVLAYEHLHPDLGSLLLKCNIEDAKNMPIIAFWKDVLISWCAYNFKESSTKADVRSQVLWFHSCLKIGGQLYMINKARKAGIIYVKDIVHDNGDIFTLDEIHHWHGHCITLMQYNGLKSCIPKKMERMPTGVVVYYRERGVGKF